VDISRRPALAPVRIKGLDPKADAALDRCEALIKDYEDYWRSRKRLYLGFQIAAVLLGAVTPVLLLVTELPKALQALPAAIAAFLVAVVAICHWQENVARCAYAAEALQSERAKFILGATDRYKNENNALEAFVDQIEGIRMTEVRGWRTDWQRSEGKKDP
jgi:Protein of unknown function (DUF4231)